MNNVKGRFAPSPTGRMHLGNIFTALISWLSVRKKGGSWVLRIEDLDPQRSKREHALRIEDDLDWLGLVWDEGGLGDSGPCGPYSQSARSEIYSRYLSALVETGYTYPCTCTRAGIMATQAPHQSDGRIIYGGTCRPSRMPSVLPGTVAGPHATRLFVPDEEIGFSDRVFGPQSVNLSSHCGDFVLRRADGAWAYQLAVVVDDALMGITEVVRGCDLLLSTAQQIYLYRMFAMEPPGFAHVPLLCNHTGRRLSKRDASMSMEHMRLCLKPEEIIGRAAFLAGITDEEIPCRPDELVELFDWGRVPVCECIDAE